MAILAKNSIFSGVSGRIGDLVFRQVNGKTIVAARPRTRRKKSPARNNRFSRASEYAIMQVSDQATYDEYAKGITDRKTSAYMVAFTDFMTPPQIHAIDTRSYRGRERNTIRIKATDDFKVKAVEVRIVNPAGKEVEYGQAIQVSKTQWHYRTTQVNATLPGTRVIVTASDRPGNCVTVEKLLN